MSKEMKIIEAALFMSPNPLSIAELQNIAGTADYSAVKSFCLGLMQEFNERDSALEIVQVDDRFQMKVRREFDRNVASLASDNLFHKGMMKTLAFISFKQPVDQSTVIKYRNNKAYDHIARLLEEGFITKEPKGRTYALRTTKKFLEQFGSSV